MDEIRIFENQEFGKIRTVIIDDEPWFVSADVSKALGYVRTPNMVKLVDDEDKRNISSSDLEQQVYKQSYTIGIINESGLYAAIFGSKQENAKKFKRWVTSEVLPQIRKTGAYANLGTIQKIKSDIPIGEVASLSKVMDRIMVRQESKPHEIARAFEMLCGQFGIQLPKEFVNIPKYEQYSLSVGNNNELNVTK